MGRDTPSRTPRRQEDMVEHTRQNPGGPGETLENLQVALEELRLAQEELRQQNEELANARGQLERERQRYQELFEFAPNPYLVTDLLGIVLQANQSATRLLRLDPSFLPGKALATYVAKRRPSPLPGAAECRSQGQPVPHRVTPAPAA